MLEKIQINVLGSYCNKKYTHPSSLRKHHKVSDSNQLRGTVGKAAFTKPAFISSKPPNLLDETAPSDLGA